MTNLMMKGTKGRDASPRTHQQKGFSASKPPRGVEYTGKGTPVGGEAPEAKGTSGGKASGTLDPSMFNNDGHAIRAFSRYMEGKRAGPDWLHKRVESAQRAREDEGWKLLSRS